MNTRFDDPRSQSRALFERARQVIPGGTSKANLYVRPHPFYLADGHGCRVTDVDGIERLDAINNFTALIHGHAFPPAPPIPAVYASLLGGSWAAIPRSRWHPVGRALETHRSASGAARDPSATPSAPRPAPDPVPQPSRN